MPPCINATTISIMKNLQYNFSKMRGGGQRPLGFFPKNSSDLVAGSFPKSSVTNHFNTCNIWYIKESMESLQNSFVRTPFSVNPFLSYPVSTGVLWECGRGCGCETVNSKLC